MPLRLTRLWHKAGGTGSVSEGETRRGRGFTPVATLFWPRLIIHLHTSTEIA
jgi:hypothetical protein